MDSHELADAGEGRSVAFIGVGRMGGRMARRLVGAKMTVAVYDRDRAAVDALAQAGARAAASPADAAEGADLVLCSLPGPAQLQEATSGSGGVLETARDGALVVDMTTADPGTSRAVAAACAERGVRFLDAPVSRGIAGAENGTLAMLVGGEAADLEDARPVLELLARDIVHVGAVGAGQIAKLCNNMLGAIHATALGEVLAAGVRAGIGLAELTAAIRSSSGNSFLLEHYLPNGLFTQERPTTFALSLMRKDIRLFMTAGADVGAPLPLSAFVQQAYTAAAAAGLDDADCTSIAELYERLAGVELRLTSTGEGRS
jgi:3-hydroxyisobutyrate dehydrogenase